MKEQIIAFVSLVSSVISLSPFGGGEIISPLPKNQILAERELALNNRLPDKYGNEVFADNILLSLHYLKGDANTLFSENRVDWEKAREPFVASFTLKPGEVFAFHGNILPALTGSVPVTMNSRFYIEEGYKSFAGLGGNGVCHLASLINWTAQGAGLEVIAEVNHDFAPVPGVPKEFGTSIRSQSPKQNLYIKNNQDFSVIFEFKINQQKVFLRIIKN